MYISKMQHSLDESGDIPKHIPKQAREISAFFSLVIDETIKTLPTTLTSTGIRCFKKRCTGIISSEVFIENNEIHWKCSKCRNEGTIYWLVTLGSKDTKKRKKSGYIYSGKPINGRWWMKKTEYINQSKHT